jgi:tetratricopeptide (TPR) repeat protein
MKLLPTFPFNAKPVGLKRITLLLIAFAALGCFSSRKISAQSTSSPSQSDSFKVEGTVRNAAGEPLAGAYVRLEEKNREKPQETKTNPDGAFIFLAARAGTYTLRAEKSGWRDAVTPAFTLLADETKKIDLVLQALAAVESPSVNGGKTSPSAVDAMEFKDEPSFTVAGITDYSNLGLHGSDASARTSDKLATATVHLNSGTGGDGSNLDATISKGGLERARDQVRKDLATSDTAEGHRMLGNLDERLGDPLAAVREYEQAARMEPSEQNYFEWGAELLLHRAGKPAQEVFAKGFAAHPDSARMLAGLGTALYAIGSDEEAALRLCEAADLKPSDPAPYIFLGQMEKATSAPLPCSQQKLERFAKQQPGNAQANYYYAISLRKRERSAGSLEALRKSEMLLQKAVSIDPQFAEAFVELGNLYFERAAFDRAIGAYQKAIEVSPNMSQAHYRLSLAYRRMGEPSKAEQEFQIYKQNQKAETADVERQRREMQQFLVILKEGPEVAAPR